MCMEQNDDSSKFWLVDTFWPNAMDCKGSAYCATRKTSRYTAHCVWQCIEDGKHFGRTICASLEVTFRI